MLAWVDMLSSPSVVMILAIVGVHVPPPFFLKGGFLSRSTVSVVETFSLVVYQLRYLRSKKYKKGCSPVS